MISCLFLLAMPLERQNPPYTATLAGTQAKIMPNICKIVTQGKFKLYGNASRPSPKAKEKEKTPGAASVPWRIFEVEK